MNAESTECPNCKRPCSVGEALWRKATCVNSLCRTKFLVQVTRTPVDVQSAPDKKTSSKSWGSGSALLPIKAGPISVDPEEEFEDAPTDRKKEHRRVQTFAIRLTFVIAVCCSLLFLFFTFLPEYGFQSTYSIPRSGNKTRETPQVDEALIGLLELSYSTINAMNLRPDAEAATVSVEDWEQARLDGAKSIVAGDEMGDQLNAIGMNLRQSLEYLTSSVNDVAEAEEAKVRFTECLRDATKAADRLWMIPGFGDGAKRFQENAIHYIAVARRIAKVLKGVSVSQPNGLIAQEMNEFTDQLNEEFDLVSPPTQYVQISTYNLRTIYDCLIDAMKNYHAVFAIRNNAENPMKFNNLEASKHAQRFYASLRLGQELIESEEQLHVEWKHAKELDEANSQ
jgi:hypothetical protein